MENKTYSVGQVLYVIPNKKTVVLPVRVIEEVQKKSLDGTSTSYVVSLGPKNEKILNMSKINGEVFESAEQVKHALIKRSTEAINDIIETAMVQASDWYSTDKVEPQIVYQNAKKEAKEVVIDATSDPPNIKQVRMPDGEIVKVDIDS